MKYLLVILLTLTFFQTAAQIQVSRKTWVGTDSTYLTDYHVKPGENALMFEKITSRYGNIRQEFYYELKGDTLLGKSSGAGGPALFLLDTTVKNKLTLKPINQAAEQVFYFTSNLRPAKTMVFYDSESIHTDTVKFEKLRYMQTKCYGPCPALAIEIDNKGNFKYIDQKDNVYRYSQIALPAEYQHISDEDKQKAVDQWGYFSSHFSKPQYRQLTDILKRSDLDRLIGNHYFNSDAPQYFMEIYYNNKVLTFNTYELPIIVEELHQFLVTLPGKVRLVKSDNKFQIPFKDGVIQLKRLP